MDKEYQQLIEEAKSYAKLRYDLLKLEFLEKSSKIVAILLVSFLLVLIALAALTYFSVAAVYALTELWGSMILSLCIVGAAYILFMLIFYLLRKPLILNPIIKRFSSILFKKND